MKKKKIGKNCCVMICKVYVPMGIFPNISVHQNFNCRLKI